MRKKSRLTPPVKHTLQVLLVVVLVALVPDIFFLAPLDVAAPPPTTAPAGAPVHQLSYSPLLQDGSALHVSVAGDEDPWRARVRFHGAVGGAVDPQFGDARAPGPLAENEETGWMPLKIAMGDQDVKARATSGHFLAQIEYEEGRVPVLSKVRVTSDGIVAIATDPNQDSGDNVTVYEFTVHREDEQVVVIPPVHQGSATFVQLPSKPGTYHVSVRVQDARGAWSVTLGKMFKLVGTLSGVGGANAIQEGETTLNHAATDQNGDAILEATRPGGGLANAGRRTLSGFVRVAGCPGICRDAFAPGTFASRFWPISWREHIREVLT